MSEVTLFEVYTRSEEGANRLGPRACRSKDTNTHGESFIITTFMFDHLVALHPFQAAGNFISTGGHLHPGLTMDIIIYHLRADLAGRW